MVMVPRGVGRVAPLGSVDARRNSSGVRDIVPGIAAVPARTLGRPACGCGVPSQGGAHGSVGQEKTLILASDLVEGLPGELRMAPGFVDGARVGHVSGPQLPQGGPAARSQMPGNQGPLPFVPKELGECRFFGEVLEPSINDLLAGGATRKLKGAPYLCPDVSVSTSGRIKIALYCQDIEICLKPRVPVACSVLCECEEGNIKVKNWQSYISIGELCFTFTVGYGNSFGIPVISQLLAAGKVVETFETLANLPKIVAKANVGALAVAAALEAVGLLGDVWCRTSYVEKFGWVHPCDLP